MQINHSRDQAGVNTPGHGTPGKSQQKTKKGKTMKYFLLSLFPGIDLLGKAFERRGHIVVRAPDLITGGDIREFTAPEGKFDGVIGGAPCQDFSAARRSPPTGYGILMLAEFKRIVEEAKPEWFLLENVNRVPDMQINGYSHLRIDLNARDCGSKQNRPRIFQFGATDGRLPNVTRRQVTTPSESQPCAMASEGNKKNRCNWLDFCRLQGLQNGIELPGWTKEAKYRAVGNGVPLEMGDTIAKAIEDSRQQGAVTLCKCGCGRDVTPQATQATPACRKREQRRRQLIDSIPKQI
jgi:DNA (cytosine-5)-methyltransferase 1